MLKRVSKELSAARRRSSIGQTKLAFFEKFQTILDASPTQVRFGP